MQDPKLPSKEEVEEHNVTHLPYMSWYRHCVRGRGKELPHRKTMEDPVMHEFHFDWAFPGDEGERGGDVEGAGGKDARRKNDYE